MVCLIVLFPITLLAQPEVPSCVRSEVWDVFSASAEEELTALASAALTPLHPEACLSAFLACLACQCALAMFVKSNQTKDHIPPLVITLSMLVFT